jgi:gamma-glutamyl phosphate reductase
MACCTAPRCAVLQAMETLLVQKDLVGTDGFNAVIKRLRAAGVKINAGSVNPPITPCIS